MSTGGTDGRRRPSAPDELLIHQTPDLFGTVVARHPHWRESYFFDVHSPDGTGDAVFLTMASYPALARMDSLQMGKVAGQPVFGLLARDGVADFSRADVGAARVEIVRPFEELALFADPDEAAIGLDLTFVARSQPYSLRRGTMRAGDDVVWDQSHILQSGTYHGTYSVGGTAYEVDGWLGQRDHSWGIRDHGRCPLWLWFQIQFEDGFLGVWHWELANGARVYTDGCFAPADGGDPVPVVDFRHDVAWQDAAGPVGYGEHGERVTGLAGSCVFTLAGGRSVAVEAEGTFDRPYEPFRRGGLNQMRVRADDGRTGTAIYEVTGARHHRYFPDTVVEGVLPE